MSEYMVMMERISEKVKQIAWYKKRIDGEDNI